MIRADDPTESKLASTDPLTGYRSVDDFLSATQGLEIRFFEPNRADLTDPGMVKCTQAERREGKRGLLRWLFETLGREPLDYFEFGVMNCATFNRVIEWTSNDNARFYGFDTFSGLPEDWVRTKEGGGLKIGRAKGELKAADDPAVYDRRATLFKGLFQDTLPEALARAFPAGRHADRPLFVNIDSDLYSSALFAATSMHPLLRSGDYVYYDEFFDRLNEFAAFNDYVRAYNCKSWYVPVARAYDGVLFRVVPEGLVAAEVIDRNSTAFLARMKEYIRTRISMRKRMDPGRLRDGAPPQVG